MTWKHCRRHIAAVVVAGVAAASTFASGVDTTDTGRSIEWYCVQEFDEKYEVRCIAEETQIRNAMNRSDQRPPANNNSDDGRTDGVIPAFGIPVAMRTEREIFAEGAWKVPLYAQPSNPSAVTQLLQSVLCGARQQCSVRYGTDALVKY